MNSREIIVKSLDEILYKKAYSNLVINNNLNRFSVNRKDKALITEIVYGTLKYKYTIDCILEHYIKRGLKSVEPTVLNILRISIYQIRYLDKVPDFAVVNEAVNLSKKYSSQKTSKFVNGVLRNYLRNQNIDYFKGKLEDELCFNYSFPKWMVNLIIRQYGSDICEKILKGLNEIPAVTVRVNNLRSSYDDVYGKLIDLGYDVGEGKICPEAINIFKGESIESNLLFREGLITVQDESAMLVAPLMDLNKNIVALDLCSAPGGKATHMAEIMDNTGEIMSFDIHKNKLNLIRQNAQRLGIDNIRCCVQDATKFNEDLVNISDRVLIDVPCSGLGIIRKKPEIKWNKSIKDLKDLICIQRKILVNASQYIKKGGILLYSTCTLNKDENEKNIQWFIKNHPQFKIEPIHLGAVDNIIYDERGFVTILPNKFMDGFFIAKLKKQW